MKPSFANLEQASVAQQCRALRLPAVADQCASLAEEAIKQRAQHHRTTDQGCSPAAHEDAR
jgi:hypothetical protein